MAVALCPKEWLLQRCSALLRVSLEHKQDALPDPGKDVDQVHLMEADRSTGAALEVRLRLRPVAAQILQFSRASMCPARTQPIVLNAEDQRALEICAAGPKLPTIKIGISGA